MEYNSWVISAIIAVILFVVAIVGWIYTRNSKVHSWVWLVLFLSIIMSIAALSVYMHNHYQDELHHFIEHEHKHKHNI